MENNSIDKTRQDKTRIVHIYRIVKWWCLVIWIILSTTLLKVQTEFMTRIIYARQFRLVPEVGYSRKSLKKQNALVDCLTVNGAINTINRIEFIKEILHLHNLPICQKAAINTLWQAEEEIRIIRAIEQGEREWSRD